MANSYTGLQSGPVFNLFLLCDHDSELEAIENNTIN